MTLPCAWPCSAVRGVFSCCRLYNFWGAEVYLQPEISATPLRPITGSFNFIPSPSFSPIRLGPHTVLRGLVCQSEKIPKRELAHFRYKMINCRGHFLTISKPNIRSHCIGFRRPSIVVFTWVRPFVLFVSFFFSVDLLVHLYLYHHIRMSRPGLYL